MAKRSRVLAACDRQSHGARRGAASLTRVRDAAKARPIGTRFSRMFGTFRFRAEAV